MYVSGRRGVCVLKGKQKRWKFNADSIVLFCQPATTFIVNMRCRRPPRLRLVNSVLYMIKPIVHASLLWEPGCWHSRRSLHCLVLCRQRREVHNDYGYGVLHDCTLAYCKSSVTPLMFTGTAVEGALFVCFLPRTTCLRRASSARWFQRHLILPDQIAPPFFTIQRSSYFEVSSIEVSTTRGIQVPRLCRHTHDRSHTT